MGQPVIAVGPPVCCRPRDAIVGQLVVGLHVAVPTALPCCSDSLLGELDVRVQACWRADRWQLTLFRCVYGIVVEVPAAYA
jgi:hypothetical protein